MVPVKTKQTKETKEKVSNETQSHLNFCTKQKETKRKRGNNRVNEKASNETESHLNFMQNKQKDKDKREKK